MTVGDLKEALECLDEDLEVRLMTQESWPFENSLLGTCQREDFIGPEEMQMMSSDDPSKENCFFLVGGKQLCYGDKSAWEACR